ncbi:MAG: TIGR04282 family arsenosugar biosynthesis glycosyltransferase [Candidatus Brocadiales bacterium]
MTEDVLIIFVKYPEPGKVKTRLARAIGEGGASRLYRLMAEDTVGRLGARGSGRHRNNGEYETIVFYDPPEKFQEIKDWLGGGLRYIEQSGKNLGERLAGAFDVVFCAGARRVAVVGTDCPGVTQDTVTKALARLREKDVVIGPAADGGYYLIGLSRNAPELFASIDWSTDMVFNQTLENVERLGLSFTTLEVMKDVDELSDLSAEQLHSIERKA